MEKVCGVARGAQFDDTELPDIAPLDLWRDGMWGSEHYVDAPEPERDRPWRRRAARFVLRAVAVLAVLLAVGTAYERIEGWRQRRNLQRVGQPVDIGGRSLNVSCLGETGPTVLFESGGGGVGYWWVGIQREVATFARACWYDRAGHGWSDPAPYPRDAKASAADLRRLIESGAVKAPLILVGASLGGLIVRVYASQNPADVAGLVLVDSSHADERDSIPPTGEMSVPRWLHRGLSAFAHFLWRVGAIRFFFGDDDPGPPDKGLTEQDGRCSTPSAGGAWRNSRKCRSRKACARRAPRRP